jgi:hypothetical protein
MIQLDDKKIEQEVVERIASILESTVAQQIRQEVLSQCQAAVRQEVKKQMDEILLTYQFPKKDGTTANLRDFILGWLSGVDERDYSKRPHIQRIVENMTYSRAEQILREVLETHIPDLKATIKRNVVEMLLSRLE